MDARLDSDLANLTFPKYTRAMRANCGLRFTALGWLALSAYALAGCATNRALAVGERRCGPMVDHEATKFGAARGNLYVSYRCALSGSDRIFVDSSVEGEGSAMRRSRSAI